MLQPYWQRDSSLVTQFMLYSKNSRHLLSLSIIVLASQLMLLKSVILFLLLIVVIATFRRRYPNVVRRITSHCVLPLLYSSQRDTTCMEMSLSRPPPLWEIQKFLTFSLSPSKESHQSPINRLRVKSSLLEDSLRTWVVTDQDSSLKDSLLLVTVPVNNPRLTDGHMDQSCTLLHSISHLRSQFCRWWLLW